MTSAVSFSFGRVDAQRLRAAATSVLVALVVLVLAAVALRALTNGDQPRELPRPVQHNNEPAPRMLAP